MSDLRGKIFTALTGQDADVSGKVGGDLRGMLLAVGGASSKTKSGINLTAAAQRLGVSRRTVERWVQTAKTGTGQRPSAQHAKDLAATARKAATTKAGRQAALSGSGVAKSIAKNGARLKINGMQGPSRGKDYFRKRVTMLELDPWQAEAMIEAYENGGEKGFMAWATAHFDTEYVSDWQFESIDSIDVERPYGGSWS